MAPQSFSTSSSIIFLLFSLSSLYYISHAHYNSSSPLDFLKNMNGTHKGDLSKGLSELKKYLTNLGYIQQNITTNDDVFDDTLESAIEKYQQFYNLKITGILDQETIDSLSQPRCGVPDFPSHANISSSFYTFFGPTWPPGKRYLTFSYPKNIRNDARLPVVKASIRWSKVSPFRFIYKDDFGNVDVKISFERRDHGDGFPFDGPNGVLAHAFPPTDGRLHFDAEESWQTYRSQGVFDLESVALHELGHILGLGHSQDPRASMYAYFKPGEKRDLNDDDIRGIHALYPR